MRGIAAAVILGAAVQAAPATEGAVRALARAGGTCWAVGDRGLILRSRDGGRTWRRLACEVAADFSAVHFADGLHGCVLGGRPLPGHPQGRSIGVILTTRDGGESFRPMPAEGLGHVHGGRIEGARGVVFGEATWSCPAGTWISVLGGRTWVPVRSSARGRILGGAFMERWSACLVGPDQRICLLEGLVSEPQAEISSDAALRAACRGGGNLCWASGENGSVLAVDTARRSWRAADLSLPRGTRRLADLEAVAADGDAVYAAGGLTGRLFRRRGDGMTFDAVAAPGPGPVHALLCLSDGALLAGGDGGRIWRAAAAEGEAAEWTPVRGSESVDVLFVAAPGDVSILPALAAHAAAGADVSVLYAAVPDVRPAGSGTPLRGELPLRSAAALAGAGGATVLSDFPSVAGDPGAASLTEREVLERLAARVDVPAREELLRQMTAAIRLYRPKVLACGPSNYEARGTRAENRLISRLAQEAAGLAADAKAQSDLARVGLRPWTVQRVYAGFDDNDRPRPPWKPPAPAPKQNVAAAFVGHKYPVAAAMSLDMLALRASAAMPWTDATDRAAAVTAYRCSKPMQRRELFTSGLSPATLAFGPGGAGGLIASGAVLRVGPARRGGPAAAVQPLLKAARAHPADPRPPDLLYRVMGRAFADGDLTAGAGVLRAYLAHGRAHPQSDRLGFAAAAMSASAEWSRQARVFGPAPREPARVGPAPPADAPPADAPPAETADFAAMADRMRRWPRRAWLADEPGEALLARVQAGLLGKPAAAAAACRRILRLSADPRWRSYAQTELVRLGAADARTTGEGIVADTGAGKNAVDGRLDEPFWKRAYPIGLKPAPGVRGPGAAATVQLAALPTHLAVGVRVPAGEGADGPGRWALTVAIDADRDTWTQLVLDCDSGRGRNLRLLTRLAPPAALRPALVPLQARREARTWCIELAVPRAALGPPTGKRSRLIRMQVRVSLPGRADAPGPLYLAPQDDDRLLPHRYTLVVLPAAQPGPGGGDAQ